MPRLQKYLYFLYFVLILTIIYIYWPGLTGDFEFDDSVNLLDNPRLPLNELSWSELWRVAHSGDAGVLGRPISMLTFSLNQYFFGVEPFSFKLTNLIIHVFVALSIIFLIRSFLIFLDKVGDINLGAIEISYLPLLVTAFWAFHPLNLTSVLYVVQRMTSLSALFTVCGLVLYSKGRIRLLIDNNRLFGWIAIVFGLVVFTLLGALSKESGALLPLYALAIEATIFKFRVAQKSIIDGLRLRQLWGVFVIVSAAAVGGALYLKWESILDIYKIRQFNFGERLWTEARVLFFYCRLILLPDISKMGLYHDDFEISVGWFSPITTIISVIGWAVIGLSAYFYRTKYFMFSFAVFWFFCAHALESTIWPLELVHEHRNYLASLGILFYGVVTIYLWKPSKRLVQAKFLLVPIFLIVLSVLTWIRSDQWGNLVDHAAIEQLNHPSSDRANYQFGRMYFKLYMQEKKYEYAEKAYFYLNKAKNSPYSDNGGYFGLVQLAFLTGQPLSLELMKDLNNRLKSRPFAASNVSFIQNLINCQLYQYCKLQEEEIILLLQNANENPTVLPSFRSALNSASGLYYANRLNDYKRAEVFLKDAIHFELSPQNVLNLAELYRVMGDISKARSTILWARDLDVKLLYSDVIARQLRDLDKVEKEQAK
ncbi:hypothetical protein [Chitinivorax sp. B]|uniref:hypothetical protein n=1 Tax=Chitinivorax sp. B TaxID=2502235 RepID=UPI0014852B08|nr:hypothetical protein [Chitinivorax sp. B]